MVSLQLEANAGEAGGETVLDPDAAGEGNGIGNGDDQIIDVASDG